MLPPVHISYSLKNQIVKCYTNYEQKCIPSTKTFRILSYFKLFRFATYKEYFLILLGIIFTSIAAVGLPYNVILYGEFTTLLIDRSNEFSTSTPTLLLQLFGGGRLLINATMKENQLALLDDSKAFGIGCTIGALLQFICLTFGIYLINYSAVKQINRMRKLFFYSMLRQDMSWYDTVPDCNISSRITDDFDKIKQGIGDKLAVFIYLIMSFIICVLVAFFYGWLLTLVILSCTPIIIIATILVARIQSSLTENEMQSYSLAGNVAKEVFSSIRTVIAFGGAQKECEQYKNSLKTVESNGKIKCLYSGLGNGLMWLIIYCCYALAFWYGFQLIINSYNNNINNDGDREYTPAVLVIIVFGILTGAQNFGLTAPHLETFTTAIGAANIIFNIIDKNSKIDSLSCAGEFPIIITGNLIFRNVSFRYPVRDDITILNKLNLSIKAGQKVALVGSAGSGKSTILQLIQRLYDPSQGSIEIDGININTFNTSWLRSMIGVVAQDPLLFSVSISENICYGNPLVSQRDIEIAARIANCHYFIMKLPNRYSTIIGERGHIQLSVGQKQRIAIARAIVADPKILLLDEATSALDYNSAKIVQNALDKACYGRTTIIISHRLSTIINVDKIVFIENGCVAEQGSYRTLMEKKGFYYNLMNVKEHDCAKQLKDMAVKQRNSSSSSVSSIIQYSEIESDECDKNAAQDNNSNINNNVEKNKNNDLIKEDENYNVSLITLMRLNSPEWFYILIGFLASTINGLMLPICAILLGEIYGLLSLTDLNTLQQTSALYSMLFILIGFIAGVTAFLQIYFINFAGVQLTSRLRQLFFNAIIKQEIGWFDDVTRNSTDTICTRLSGDCAKVQGATGSRIASILQSISSLSIGLAISFYYSWELTLVSIIAISIVFVASLFESRCMETSYLDEKMAMENACKIATEAIVNIRTIASLGREIFVYDSYVEEMNKSELACRRRIFLRGCIFALGQTTPFFAYALALYYGGTLVANDGLEYKNVIKVSEALIIGSWALAEALSFAPDVNAALLSAGRLIKILNKIPKYYDQTMMTDAVPDSLNTTGNIRYCNVNFSYPNRLNVPAIKNLTLDIQNGSTIALVGQSGCGKSTFIQLLLRFYDPASGHIELNGTSINVYPIEYLRLQMGIVSQKTMLFNRKISENIAYGDNTRDQIPLTEIIEAAKMANIHEFISTLPLGYDTLISSNGLQLSDGHKQRIAIARVLIRNPKILLLDEVTSALDKQNEQIVQEILNRIRIGRTCIIVAHRLNTIKNVDLICVLQNGEIIEKGTHNELIKMNGIYSNLYEMES